MLACATSPNMISVSLTVDAIGNQWTMSYLLKFKPGQGRNWFIHTGFLVVSFYLMVGATVS